MKYYQLISQSDQSLIAYRILKFFITKNYEGNPYDKLFENENLTNLNI